MPDETRRVPDYVLELAAAGDPATADVLERVAREEGGRERLAALSRDDAVTLARLPPGAVVAEVERRAAARRRRAWLLLPALAAAAAASLAIAPVVRGPAGPMDGTRAKGPSPHLVVHRRTGAGAERLAPGAPARAGDLLQLGYVGGSEAFGVIVSIDGRGAVTLHWPIAGATAEALPGGREVLLPESFRLDDAPAFERFVVVTSPRPFPVSIVLDAARTVASRPDARDVGLGLPGGLAEASILVPKEIR